MGCRRQQFRLDWMERVNVVLTNRQGNGQYASSFYCAEAEHGEEATTLLMEWIGKFAQVKSPGTPGWGPEGHVSYPAGIGGFILRADDNGRAVVKLSHFYGRVNGNLAAYGEVAFPLESLHLSDAVRTWGEDDRT